MNRIFVSCCFALTIVFSAQAQVNFPDGTSQETGELSNVIVIQAEGTDTENGTALKNAMSAIDSNNTTRIVIQLAAGTYDLGSIGMSMRPFVMIRGVGRQYSVIIGTGIILIEGHNETVLRDLQLWTETSSTTLLQVQSGHFTDCFRVSFFFTSTGGVNAIGVAVYSGAEVDLIACDISGDVNNSGGSVTGIAVTQSDSAVFSSYTILDLIDLSTDGVLTGATVTGCAEFEIINGEYLIDRENAGDPVTGISIGSGSRAILKNSSLRVAVVGDDSNSDAVTSSGTLTAFGTLFEGNLPSTGIVTYSQCLASILGFVDET